jgi:hypothetical protein
VVVASDEYFTAFKAIFPHSVFEQQLDRNREIRAQIQAAAQEAGHLSADIGAGIGALHIEVPRIKLNTQLLEAHFIVDPWQNWHDIRPPLNLLILWLAIAAQVLILIRIYRHASRRLVLSTQSPYLPP